MSLCFPQNTTSTFTTTSNKVTTTLILTQLPNEVQIHILSYLRSYDLGPVQRVCRFYNNVDRIHDVVTFLVHHVYGSEFCEGAIEVEDTEEVDDSIDGVNVNSVSNNKKKLKENISSSSSKKNNNRKHPNHKKSNDNSTNTSNANANVVVKDVDVEVEVPSSSSSFSNTTTTQQQCRYTLTHLRSIELAVVARVLSLPEPKTGFYVSKSWIKKTLLWLELEQQKDKNANEKKAAAAANNKKLSKKQQRQKNRRLSDVLPPATNVNSDIVCEHQNLQRSGAKAARSHRRLMDKKSWKVLRKLYPDSIQLESTHGECLQCLMEAETYQKNESDKLEHAKLLRKQPLSNPHVRRFYTRTRGIPYHCLVEHKDGEVKEEYEEDEEEQDQKPKSIPYSVNVERCPLTSGTYVILPRSWCHQWRRYMKTGDGCKPLPPDSSSLLCDAHKLALLPVSCFFPFDLT
jgi:hypothetical protein